MRLPRGAPIRAPLAAATCLFLLAGACASAPRASESQTRTVRVDGSTRRFKASFLAYFPTRVEVRQGDTISFKEIWSGEPHTVTMGTLVETQLAAARALPAGAPVPEGLPGLPRGRILPAPAKLVLSAAEPCYLESGSPLDASGPCPRSKQKPAFNGRQTYYNSGFIGPRETFRMKLAPDIAPGTYSYTCAFHAPRMSGQIVVRARGASAPPQGDVERIANGELKAMVDAMLPAYTRTLDKFKRSNASNFPFPAYAGLLGGNGSLVLHQFIPFTTKVKLGKTVTWSVWGDHVIAFRPPRNSGPPAIQKLENGAVVLNADALKATHTQPPEAPPAAPVAINNGRFTRDDTVISGLLQSPTQGLIVYGLRFNEPGTYRYRCLIHPGMGGLITVSL